jgi:diguanylate cyclase (GGDEF)-like protein
VIAPARLALRLACLASVVLVPGTEAVAAHQGWQPIRFRHLSLDDGLSQATVTTIYQDSRGFMWLGTVDGLNRYDGHSVVVYDADLADLESLPASTVWAITEDQQGDLWVATEGGGIGRWDHRTDRFVRYGHPDDPAVDAVRALLLEERGLWLATRESGLWRLDPQAEGHPHQRASAPELSSDAVFAVSRSRSGHLWIGTDGGVDRFDPSRGTVEPVSLGDGAGARVRALLETRDGALWVGTAGEGLVRYDPGSEEVQFFRHDPNDSQSLPHDVVRALLEDDEGRLWAGTARGLALLYDRSGRFHTYRHEPAMLTSLRDDYIMSLYQDRGGVIWVGTRSAGVSRWHPETWIFGHHAPGPEGLADGTVTNFAMEGDHVLWVGTLGGLHRLDRSTGTVEIIRRVVDQPGGLSSDRVTTVLVDRRGALWAGTLNAGLNRLDRDATTFRTYRHLPDQEGGLGADGVTSLLEDHRGQLWVGTFGGGLHRYNPERDAFERFLPNPDDSSSLSSAKVISLAEGPSGDLWIGTDGGGLNRLDRFTGAFQSFRHDPNDAETIGSDTIFSLYVDPREVVWAGTRGAGLTRLELLEDGRGGVKASIRRLPPRELPNAQIYGIQPDDHGGLWLSTNRGLARLDPGTGTVAAYDVSHGLQQNEFTSGAHYRSPAGELFFGGVNGFNAFFPHRIRFADRQPQIALTSISSLKHPLPELPTPWSLDSLRLGHGAMVTLELAALDYAAPEKSSYSYRLDGFDPDWVDLGSYRRITFNNLPPGDYVLRVRAAIRGGSWSEQPPSLFFVVEPPLWQTWWAYLAYLTLAGLGVVSFVGLQRRKLRHEEAYSRRLGEQVRDRTRELADKNLELERLNSELVEASLTDSLTGLRNRRFLFRHMDEEALLVDRRYRVAPKGGRVTGLDLVLMMLDIDHFKSINDNCGHLAGDEVLIQLRQVLESCCRRSDILIRWGGDELLVIGRDSCPEEAEAVAQRLLEKIRSHVFTVNEGQVARATCSIGYACYPFQRSNRGAFSWQDVLLLADLALYAAKRSGRDGWVGLMGCDATPANLLPRLRHEPEEILAEGLVTVRCSRDPAALIWR